MSSSIPLQIAETIQTASINPEPSAQHDINPSTAASEKVPVEERRVRISHTHGYGVDEVDDGEVEDDEDISVSVLRPAPRPARPQMPPLPDLRFEQSVLRSLEHADTWWKVVMVISRDQVGIHSQALCHRPTLPIARIKGWPGSTVANHRLRSSCLLPRVYSTTLRSVAGKPGIGMLSSMAQASVLGFEGGGGE